MKTNDPEMSSQEHQTADVKANGWVWWCATRRLFAPTVKSNILARLQPPSRPSRGEPNAFLDADMSYFNMAIHALCEQGGHDDEAECFLGIYWYNTHIKALAAQQQCARGTIYNRARRFAQRAESLSRSIRRVHESFVSEKCSKIIEQNSCATD